LIQEQRRLGNKWATIAQLLPGRSTNQVKNRWYHGHKTSGLAKQTKSSSANGSPAVPTPWTEAEDSILIQEFSRVGYKWTTIAQLLPGRSTSQVKYRWCQKHQEWGLGKQTQSSSAKKTSDQVQSRTKGPSWTEEEDSILIQEQSRLGNKWAQISQLLPGRSRNQVKNRWYQRLQNSGLEKQIQSSSAQKTREQVRSRDNGHLGSSSVTNPWTETEDSILIQVQSRLGNKWARIAQLLPGRSGDQVKNRWYQRHQKSGLEKQTQSSSPKKTSEQVQSGNNGHIDSSAVTTPWTEAEDSILIKAQRCFGSKWTQISQVLPGRSGDQVKHRWYYKQRLQTKSSSVKKTSG